MVHESIQRAYKVLDGDSLTRGEARQLLSLRGPDLLDLISLANKVRCRFAAAAHPCCIVNAKSGACPEDCRYCAQSARAATGAERYPLIEKDAILSAAARAMANGATCFCIVTSGRGYPEITPEFRQILGAVAAIRTRFPTLSVGASLGVLREKTAAALAENGLQTYNHNLQVSPAVYGRLVATTHRVDERIETIRMLKRLGVSVCSGGILGLGESPDDRLDLAFQLRDLAVEVIPLNVLVPIPGTPLESQAPIKIAEVALAFALFRLVNPERVIKFAAGRESLCGDFQGLLMLAGANGFLTGGYLTTRGRTVGEDVRFGLELEAFLVS